jgi:hypothetical protein
MSGIYAQWIGRWERKLASRDRNRMVRPFEWGTEWLQRIAFPSVPAASAGDARRLVSAFVSEALADSGRFFAYDPVKDYGFEGNRLIFRSPALSGWPENDWVHARWLPAPRDQGRALVLLPQWNAGPEGHMTLARLLNRFGISALRMTMPYHAERMPRPLERAEYHVSSNVGRTIHACRQAVIDARACLDWLERRGYRRLGLLGTSLGSCVAFIAAAHDRRVRIGIFNHVSMYFSDVVWTGLATEHVRRGLEQQVTQDELRRYWSVISPAAYLERLAGRDLPSLLIWARYDTSFRPEYSRQVLDSFRRLGLPHQTFCLPCAHYTTGQPPFRWLDGFQMCRFAARRL